LLARKIFSQLKKAAPPIRISAKNIFLLTKTETLLIMAVQPVAGLCRAVEQLRRRAQTSRCTLATTQVQLAVRHCTLTTCRVTLPARQGKHFVRNDKLQLRRGTFSPSHGKLHVWHFMLAAPLGTHSP
jgi:hypothetical protein